MAAGASVCSKGGDSAAFFEPLGEGVARNAEDAADASQGGAFVVGPEELLFASRVVSGAGGLLDEATSAIAAAVALLALGGIAVSYGAGAMAAVVGGLCIHALYGSSTTALESLPKVVDLYVSYLRKKLDRDGEPSHIRTVRGVGYVFGPQQP